MVETFNRKYLLKLQKWVKGYNKGIGYTEVSPKNRFSYHM